MDMFMYMFQPDDHVLHVMEKINLLPEAEYIALMYYTILPRSQIRPG